MPSYWPISTSSGWSGSSSRTSYEELVEDKLAKAIADRLKRDRKLWWRTAVRLSVSQQLTAQRADLDEALEAFMEDDDGDSEPAQTGDAGGPDDE